MSVTASSSPVVRTSTAQPDGGDVALNRRRHERVDFRTAAVAIIPTADTFRCVRCQTDDVSFEGARLIGFEPLPTKLLYLRILMPGLSERFVEANVVNEREVSELRIGVGRQMRYIYGVRFCRVVTEPALIEQLNAASRAPQPGARSIR